MNLRVGSLAFAYKKFSLEVRDFSFPGGRVSVIVGPNGAGKTTLLRCLAGALPVRRGSVLIDGRDVATMKAHERARLVAFVPQEQESVFNYSVADFVLMGRAGFISPFALPSRQDFSAAREALDYVGLSSFADRSIGELSSGERRLVLIARALAQNSEVLLMDEPTTFLDPKHETEILELVRKLALEKAKTLLVTLHSLEMAVQYSDVMVFMKGGRIVASGPPAEVFEAPLLESVYEMKIRVIDWDGRKVVIR